MKKLTGSSLTILKTLHLLFITLYLGGLFASLIILRLHITGSLNLEGSNSELILFRLDGIMVYYSFLGLATTSIVYGLFTNWGILKYRWIIIKWLLLFTLAGVYIVVYSPCINGIVSLSSGGMNSDDTKEVYERLLQKSFYSNIILLSIIITIFFISTIKPFGKRNSDFLSENRIAWISLLTIVLLSVGFLFMGSINLNRLRTMKINNPDLSALNDGIYTGEFNDGGGIYFVEIEINNHVISHLNLKTERKSSYVDYARPVTVRIVEKQTLNVDAITGATTTSKCIMKAAENALKGAKKGD